MNWDAVGSIAETVAACGVILSLLFLAVQVRASVCASKVESKLLASRMYTDFLKTLVEFPEINDVFVRGREDLQSLNTEDFYRFSNLAFQAFSVFSAGYVQHYRGALNESDWFENLAIIKFWIRGKGTRNWWSRLGTHMYGSDFVNFIESEIKSLENS
ncbi:MAG: hypothetical protein V7711_17375 [Pseudomonadales bacterium]